MENKIEQKHIRNTKKNGNKICLADLGNNYEKKNLMQKNSKL